MELAVEGSLVTSLIIADNNIVIVREIDVGCEHGISLSLTTVHDVSKLYQLGCCTNLVHAVGILLQCKDIGTCQAT